MYLNYEHVIVLSLFSSTPRKRGVFLSALFLFVIGNLHSYFCSVRPDFRNVHGVSQNREGMEPTGYLSPQSVPNLPDSLWKFIDEQGHFSVA